MTDVLVRLRGAPELVLEKLIEKGFFESKSDAIRMGLVLLGKELGLLNEEELVGRKLEKLERERKRGKLKTVKWESIKKAEGL